MNILQYLLEKYPEKHWYWDRISVNSNITMDFIEKHPDKPWDWISISCNPNITMDIIEQYYYKPWSWNDISINPNISIDFIEKHIDKINFKCLSRNTFTYENKQIKKKEAYWLLEEIQAFNKLENLVILEKYM